MVTENPKVGREGSLKTLKRFSGETIPIFLENEDRREGIAKSIKSY